MADPDRRLFCVAESVSAFRIPLRIQVTKFHLDVEKRAMSSVKLLISSVCEMNTYYFSIKSFVTKFNDLFGKRKKLEK